MQEACVEAVSSAMQPDTLLLLEHHPVFTIGRARDDSSLKTPDALPHPTHQTNRGGQATYHGPGQLVGYPILDLHRHVQDLHVYLRFLEQVLIETMASFDIQAERREGLTGVWVQGRKIASIGVGVRKWITMHGFAWNITEESLPAFESIIPCGISGVEMTCLERECGKSLSVEDVSKSAADCFQSLLTTLARKEPKP